MRRKINAPETTKTTTTQKDNNRMAWNNSSVDAFLIRTNSILCKHHTLRDLCRIPIGNSGVGSVVSQSLKSGCGLLILSRTFSSSLNHFTSKWQFWSISHWPLAIAVSRSCKANCKTNNKRRFRFKVFCEQRRKRKKKPWFPFEFKNWKGRGQLLETLAWLSNNFF